MAGSLIPSSRPWTAALWGALAVAREERAPVRPQTRRRKGLCFWKQISWAAQGLFAMLRVASARQGAEHVRHTPEHGSLAPPPPSEPIRLSKLYRFDEQLPLCELWTDACPKGLGGYLTVGARPVGYFMHELTTTDCQWLHPDCCIGSAAWQTEFELFAVLFALRCFSTVLFGGQYKVFLRTDNTATLQASLTFRAKSVTLNHVAGEILLELEHLSIGQLEGRHVRGLLNDVADNLSRGVVPTELDGVQQFTLSEKDRLVKRCDWS